MHPITAILVVKGNPKHIRETLDSVKGFVSELIIADIGIDAKLLKELAAYHPKIITIPEEVPYVELIRERIKKEAKERYVLFLDPDEVIPSALWDEWAAHYRECDYVETPRKNIIMGKWIEHSRWWPDYQTRLFRKDAVVWPTVIHRQPQVTGTGYRIKPDPENAILHYNYETLDEYFGKAMRYAKSESQELVKSGNPPGLPQSVAASVSEFMSRYFADGGYRDGLHGFMLAFFQMMYPMLVYFYSREAKGFAEEPSDRTLVETTTSFFGRLFKESLYWKNRNIKPNLREKVLEKMIK